MHRLISTADKDSVGELVEAITAAQVHAMRIVLDPRRDVPVESRFSPLLDMPAIRNRRGYAGVAWRDEKTRKPRWNQFGRWDDPVAQEKAKAFYVRLLHPEPTPEPGPLTVGRYSSEWLARIAPTLATNSVASYEMVFRNHVKPDPLWMMLMVEVKRTNVRDWLVSMRSAGAKPGTLRTRLAVVRGMFDDAAQYQLRPDNPCAGILKSLRLTVEDTEDEVRSMSAEQASTWLEAVREGGREIETLSLLLWAGLRIGEAQGLQWSDVDFEDRSAQVRRQMHKTGQLGPPKSRKGKRRVDLNDDVLAMLRDLRARQREDNLRDGVPDAEQPWVLVPAFGRWPESEADAHRQRCATAMEAALRRAGIQEHFTPHGLRHTFARLNLESGADMHWLSRQMGHSSIQITVDLYGRWAQRRDHAQANRMADTVRPQMDLFRRRRV